MKIRHIGEGIVEIPGFGQVAKGDVIGVTDELGAKLCAEMPTEFEPVSEEAASPAPATRQGRSASRSTKGGGD